MPLGRCVAIQREERGWARWHQNNGSKLLFCEISKLIHGKLHLTEYSNIEKFNNYKLLCMLNLPSFVLLVEIVNVLDIIVEYFFSFLQFFWGGVTLFMLS